jgi:hypothetical protein
MLKQARKTGGQRGEAGSLLLSRARIPDPSHERPWRQRDRDQYIEMLSRRQSKRTGLPLARAREHVNAVAVSARKPVS